MRTADKLQAIDELVTIIRDPEPFLEATRRLVVDWPKVRAAVLPGCGTTSHNETLPRGVNRREHEH